MIKRLKVSILMICLKCIFKGSMKAMRRLMIMERTERQFRAMGKMCKEHQKDIIKRVRTVCRRKNVKYRKNKIEIMGKVGELVLLGYGVNHCMKLISKNMHELKSGDLAWGDLKMIGLVADRYSIVPNITDDGPDALAGAIANIDKEFLGV